MNRDEIYNALKAFEANASIESMEWRGVDFWPFVRTFLGIQLNKTTPFGGLIRAPESAMRRRLQTLRTMMALYGPFRRWQEALPGQRGCVLLVTHTDRRRSQDENLFHRMGTPLRHFLEESGRPMVTWEFEPRPWSTTLYFPPQRALPLLWMFAEERKDPAKAPDWFMPLARWLTTPPVSSPDELRVWPYWRSQLGQMLWRAQRYRSWLKLMRPRVILLDCWYHTEVLPILLAARRLGIPTVDIQHGIQGASHFGYAGWPEKQRSDLHPDMFWVWGTCDREVLKSPDNRLADQTDCVVGGSVELNYFRDKRLMDESSNRERSGGRTILVTEQKGIDISQVLAPAIEAAPAETRWMIRPHPGQPGSPLFEAVSHLNGNVILISPQHESIFESLTRSDLHVTGFSSCAIEALSLYQKTILVHPGGEEIYRRYLERGLMSLALEGGALAQKVQNTDHLPRTAFDEALKETFAPVEATREAIAKVLEFRTPRGSAQDSYQ